VTGRRRALTPWARRPPPHARRQLSPPRPSPAPLPAPAVRPRRPPTPKTTAQTGALRACRCSSAHAQARWHDQHDLHSAGCIRSSGLARMPSRIGRSWADSLSCVRISDLRGLHHFADESCLRAIPKMATCAPAGGWKAPLRSVTGHACIVRGSASTCPGALQLGIYHCLCRAVRYRQVRSCPATITPAVDRDLHGLWAACRW
jgi:hypothetical protein